MQLHDPVELPLYSTSTLIVLASISLSLFISVVTITISSIQLYEWNPVLELVHNVTPATPSRRSAYTKLYTKTMLPVTNDYLDN